MPRRKQEPQKVDEKRSKLENLDENIENSEKNGQSVVDHDKQAVVRSSKIVSIICR